MDKIVYTFLTILFATLCFSQGTPDIKSDKIDKISQTINIDGYLDELCWNLRNEKFITKQENIDDKSPKFTFLQDNLNIYFGAEYIFEKEISATDISDREIYLQIAIFPTDSTLGPYSFVIEPFDTSGNTNGNISEYCHLSSDISKQIEFSSKIIDNKWTFEFSQPKKEIVTENFRTILFRLKFKNGFLDKNNKSYYPNRRELIKVDI